MLGGEASREDERLRASWWERFVCEGARLGSSGGAALVEVEEVAPEERVSIGVD